LHGLWFDSRLGDFKTAKIILDASQMGRKGGSVKSERKAKTARENGKLGGRPITLHPDENGKQITVKGD
jgi:hypothetical protein